MMKHKLGIAMVFAGLALAVAVPQVLGADDIKKQIDAANAEFARLFAAGDAAALAARYTETGQVLPPNMEAATGRPAIEAYWGAALQSGASKVTLTARTRAIDGGAHGPSRVSRRRKSRSRLRSRPSRTARTSVSTVASATPRSARKARLTVVSSFA